jgi:hypothetical protein
VVNRYSRDVAVTARRSGRCAGQPIAPGTRHRGAPLIDPAGDPRGTSRCSGSNSGGSSTIAWRRRARRLRREREREPDRPGARTATDLGIDTDADQDVQPPGGTRRPRARDRDITGDLDVVAERYQRVRDAPTLSVIGASCARNGYDHPALQRQEDRTTNETAVGGSGLGSERYEL